MEFTMTLKVVTFADVLGKTPLTGQSFADRDLFEYGDDYEVAKLLVLSARWIIAGRHFNGDGNVSMTDLRMAYNMLGNYPDGGTYIPELLIRMTDLGIPVIGRGLSYGSYIAHVANPSPAGGWQLAPEFARLAAAVEVFDAI
jgi:hypothetical protein